MPPRGTGRRVVGASALRWQARYRRESRGEPDGERARGTRTTRGVCPTHRRHARWVGARSGDAVCRGDGRGARRVRADRPPDRGALPARADPAGARRRRRGDRGARRPGRGDRGHAGRGRALPSRLVRARAGGAEGRGREPLRRRGDGRGPDRTAALARLPRHDEHRGARRPRVGRVGRGGGRGHRRRRRRHGVLRHHRGLDHGARVPGGPGGGDPVGRTRRRRGRGLRAAGLVGGRDGGAAPGLPLAGGHGRRAPHARARPGAPVRSPRGPGPPR